MFEPPFYPIVYIRGYAMTQGEIEETVADPYMGFNLGSTKVRQRWTGDLVRHIFESPLVRLMKDHGYKDVYVSGAEPPAGNQIPSRAVWIYRYYESASKELGVGARQEIETYALGLADYIENIRWCYAQQPDLQIEPDDFEFKVYLVAHSMGGLVARCYLQNIYPNQSGISLSPVDKVFTYATPHGGIDLRFVGNVPGVVGFNNTENFNHKRMRQYLDLGPVEPVNSLGGHFPPERFFCLIGTNHRDYQVAGGAARAVVGPMSDGLVLIKNAYVMNSPRAFVHRSHSGHYGIVNSEEGYQNLRRFLFGDFRVEAALEIEDITLPPKLQERKDRAKREGTEFEIRASYHIETIVRLRGTRWDLHRRTVDEESAIFGPYDDLVKEKKELRLATFYLLDSAQVDPDRKTLGFSIELSVKVPEYEVNNKWWPDDHYEGTDLFRHRYELEVQDAEDGLLVRIVDSIIEAVPNTKAPEALCEWDEKGVTNFDIKFMTAVRPGVNGRLRLKFTQWGERKRPEEASAVMFVGG